MDQTRPSPVRLLEIERQHVDPSIDRENISLLRFGINI